MVQKHQTVHKLLDLEKPKARIYCKVSYIALQLLNKVSFIRILERDQVSQKRVPAMYFHQSVEFLCHWSLHSSCPDSVRKSPQPQTSHYGLVLSLLLLTYYRLLGYHLIAMNQIFFLCNKHSVTSVVSYKRCLTSCVNIFVLSMWIYRFSLGFMQIEYMYIII